ncbi:MAG: SlyX family protein [Paracoccaceae bacterium]
MGSDQDALDRIEALEIALAHAEAISLDLSDACAAQWREIEALRGEIGKLTRTVEALLAAGDEAAGGGGAEDQPPPHY